MKQAKSKRAASLVTTEYLDLRLGEFKAELMEEIKGETVKILQVFDDVIVRFDAKEKDEAAHSALHRRISDKLSDHDMRLRACSITPYSAATS